MDKFLMLALLVVLSFTTCKQTTSSTLDSQSSETDDGITGDSDTTDTAVVTTASADSINLYGLGAIDPVTTSDFQLSSAFGPRLKASDDYRYDFHRGIDIPGTLAQNIFSILDGTVYKAYPEGSSAYPSGGNVVVIRHDLSTPLTFHGTTITKLYAIYMHLQSFGTAAQNYIDNGTQGTVNQGDIIGAMGQSGDTSFTHLHFEIRLQTTCSLEYQLANASEGCAQYSFDPHVNPMGLYLSGQIENNYTINFISTSTTAAEIRITTTPSSLNVDGVKFQIFADSAMTQELETKTVSFNARESFDATSTTTLDSADIDGFTVSPEAFNTSSDTYGMGFTASISDSLWSGHDSLFVKATLLTTEGEVKSVTAEIMN